NDPHRDVEALFRALDERLVDLDAAHPAVERNADQQQEEDEVGGDLEAVLHFHTLSSSFALTIATTSAQKVEASVGSRITAGSVECAAARSAITVVGTNCSDAVLMARKSAWALVA